MNGKIKLVYFSATGTTKDFLHKIANEIDFLIEEEVDLTNYKYKDFVHTFDQNDIILLGCPVFGARIPKPAKNRFAGLRGNNSKIVLIITYGDVHYDDALIEIYEILKNNGFAIIGMGAFVSRHSVIKSVGINRPNNKDNEDIKYFCKIIVDKLNGNIRQNNIEINHLKTFGEYKKLPIKPIGNKNCKKCGICSILCPENAIDSKNPKTTSKEKCICCMRCVKYCPHHARNLPFIIYIISKLFLNIVKKAKYKKENKSEIIL
jgi:flavodoxin/Pyruvate/2-oxoacid:ferredoxin oxidoreductase delta subunit